MDGTESHPYPEHTQAAVEPVHSCDGIFALDIDNVVGAECEPDLEAVVARAGENDRRGVKSLCHRDAEKSDRSGPGDDHALAGDEAPQFRQPIHCRAGRHKRRPRPTCYRE